MPRKVDITWRPGEPRTRPSIEDCLGEAHAILEAWGTQVADPASMEIALAGLLAQYQTWWSHAQVAASTGKARQNLRLIIGAAKTSLSSADSTADKLRNLLNSCCDQAAFWLGVYLKESAGRVDVSENAIYGQLGRFALIPNEVIVAANKALGRLGDSRGPERSLDLLFAISELQRIYTKNTGKSATHTTYHHTHYKRAPQSEVGRLCNAFFARAPGSLSETRISTELRLQLHKGKGETRSVISGA